MELLKKISNKDIGIEEKKNVKYIPRKAARAIVFDENNKIALLFVSKYNYHKIPGGGIKEDKDIKKALQREVMEETGCSIDIKNEVGSIVEYRDELEKIQFSYCFIANVKKNYQKVNFTEKEKSHRFQLKWVELDEAIKLIEKDKPTNYEGKFIVKRDYIFLMKTKEILQ